MESPYTIRLKQETESKATVRHCMGGCAILAYALWKKLPDWEICLLEGVKAHAVLYNPEHDVILDRHGLMGFEEKAEEHYESPEWAGEVYGCVCDHEDECECQPNEAIFLDLKDEIDLLTFFSYAENYGDKMYNVKDAEKKIKDRYISFWANRIIKLAKIENPEIFADNKTPTT